MAILYWLEGLRTPVLNGIMSVVTRAGEETAFLILALAVFWCVSRMMGYYVLAVGYFGLISNQFLKVITRMPRPWLRDPNFTIVESARAQAEGYSFPSGHSQNGVGAYGCIARFTKSKWVRWICIALAVLIPFSRLYLGVHMPMDVLVGAAINLTLLLALYPLFVRLRNSRVFPPILIGIMLVSSAAYTVFVSNYHPADADAVNMAAAVKNGYTLVGASTAVFLNTLLELRIAPTDRRGKWYAQLLKLILGFGLVLAIRAGLKTPLEILFHGHPVMHAVRYFFVTGFATILWPMTFPWFSKLGRK